MSENEYTDADGITYEAKNEMLTCRGCAFEMQTSCSGIPQCQGQHRADKRAIIWVVKK